MSFGLGGAVADDSPGWVEEACLASLSSGSGTLEGCIRFPRETSSFCPTWLEQRLFGIQLWIWQQLRLGVETLDGWGGRASVCILRLREL
jgi:hypothetical protein